MKVNIVGSKQHFGQVLIRDPKSFNRYVENVFKDSSEGLNNFNKALDKLKQKHAQNKNFDILLFANDSAKKTSFEGMVMYKRLNTMVGWICTDEAPFKNMVSEKNKLMKFLQIIDNACPTKPFHI